MSLVQKFNEQLGEDPKLFFGAAASSATGGITSMIMAPILISAVIGGLSLTEKEAGFVMSAELVTIALVSFLVSPKMAVWSRRNTAMCGALMAIVGHLAAASVSDTDI